MLLACSVSPQDILGALLKNCGGFTSLRDYSNLVDIGVLYTPASVITNPNSVSRFPEVSHGTFSLGNLVLKLICFYFRMVLEGIANGR
jgi:hypothetical protein